MRILGLAAMVMLLAPSPALAQDRPVSPPPAAPTDPQDKPPDRTKEDTRDVLTQPARDVGITSNKIPPSLVAAANAPYDLAGLDTCRKLADEVRVLDAALGPDYPAGGPVNTTSTGKAIGGAVVNSLIPLRGVVREISGAAAKDRQLAAAMQAGFARRGFLRGVSIGKGCTDVM